MKTQKPVIEAKSLTRILPLEIPVTLVNGVSLSILQGEFVSITGPSGSGKSSLLYLLGLLDRPTNGEIYMDGQPTSNLDTVELSRLRLEKLGFVFQFHFLLPEFNVLENVMIPMNRLGKLPLKERREKAEKILAELDMTDQIKKLPSQLSGGQRQRVAIARAIANDPQVILADEPTGNLDTKNSKIVHEIFWQLVKTHSTSIVMVTHDMELAKNTDRNIKLVDGQISTVESGSRV